jgi:hypothetical protein
MSRWRAVVLVLLVVWAAPRLAASDWIRMLEPSGAAPESAAGDTLPAPAARDAAPLTRLRLQRPRIEALVVEAQLKSPTFRALVAALEQSDVLVYVDESWLLKGVAGKLHFAAVAGAYRIVRVTIDGHLSPVRRMATLAHELQHALEIAGAPDVVSEPTLAAFYRRTGLSLLRTDTYESQAAVEVGRRVLDEVVRDGAATESPT